MTANECKRIISDALSERGMIYRLTARTIDFTDLARIRMVFVQIHDWKPDARWAEIDTIARANGFRIEAR